MRYIWIFSLIFIVGCESNSMIKSETKVDLKNSIKIDMNNKVKLYNFNIKSLDNTCFIKKVKIFNKMVSEGNHSLKSKRLTAWGLTLFFKEYNGSEKVMYLTQANGKSFLIFPQQIDNNTKYKFIFLQFPKHIDQMQQGEHYGERESHTFIDFEACFK